MNDPLGDMLTRIRNAQMRGKSSVNTPASKLRRWVLDVLKDEGYIRGYSETEIVNGVSELEIELKYYEGQPVIQEIQRVSKARASGLLVREDNACCPQRSWHFHRINTQGCDVGQCRT